MSGSEFPPLGKQAQHAKVKRIVDDTRERQAAAVDATRRISVRDTIKGLYGDFAKLPAVERQKILEDRPENIDLAITDATTRQRWKPPYRQLQDALDALETTAKRSTSKIIAAIPVEHISATAERVERAKDFLIKLHIKLGYGKHVIESCRADDAKNLSKLLKEVRKTNIKKYGRPNQTHVLETIWPELNPAQIGLLRSGQFGPAIKATAERLILKRETTHGKYAIRRGVTAPHRTHGGERK
jgi:hypothetical protein